MAKFYGTVGYVTMVESVPGVWTEEIVEKQYSGDVFRNTRRLQGADKLNDDITINNQISIVADPYAYNNFHSIHYVTYMGTKWKVTGVEVEYPRLILEVGGVFNGPQT